jgi:PAS domain S-box-containing protein
MSKSGQLQPPSAPEVERLKLRISALESQLVHARESEQRLGETERLMREILALVQGGVVVYDQDLRYVFWNRFMEQVTGVSADEALGKRPLEVFPHLRAYDMTSVHRRALAGETVRSPDTFNPGTQHGKRGWTAGIYSPRRDADGSIIGIVGTVYDIT